MDMNLILEIIKVAGYIILGGLAIYFKTNGKLNKHVDEAIAEAEKEYEDATDVSSDKLQYAIDFIYGKFPLVVQKFIPRSMIEDVIESTLEQVQKYAKTELDKTIDKLIK